MKLFSRVAIVCDHTAEMLQMANALRAMLESFALRVDFHHLIQKRQVVEFFGEATPRCDYTVIFTHGDEGKHLTFHVVDQADGDYEVTHGWESVEFALTPADIAEHVRGPKGALISVACGGGRGTLPQAFLAAGYDTYVGADADYIDSDACLLFTSGLFYFLLAEDRDYAPRTYTLPEAVEQASKRDPDFELGTRRSAAGHKTTSRKQKRSQIKPF